MPIWVQFRLSVAIDGKIRTQTRPKAANAPKSAQIRGEHSQIGQIRGDRSRGGPKPAKFEPAWSGRPDPAGQIRGGLIRPAKFEAA